MAVRLGAGEGARGSGGSGPGTAVESAARVGQAVFEVAAAVAGLVAVAGIAAAGADPAWMGAVRAVCGAALLGAVTDSMILGHWYLIDPALPKVAIERLDVVSAVTLAAMTAVTLLPPGSIVPAFGDAALLAWGWLATTVFSGVLIVLVKRALAEPGYASVMSATGLLYVATMVTVGVVVTATMAPA